VSVLLLITDPCRECGGSGQDPTAPTFPCRDCRGDGVQLPHGHARCPRCDGSPQCGFCGGSGVVGDAACWTGSCDAGHRPEAER